MLFKFFIIFLLVNRNLTEEINCNTDLAIAQFASVNLFTESLATAVNNQTHQNYGYTVPEELFFQTEVQLHSLKNENFKLFSDEIEILNFKNQLLEKNINEQNINLMDKNQRLLIGDILLKNIAKHYSMKTVQLADTSRINGGAIYGEATVRNTTSSILRRSHHGFHTDKFFPSICQLRTGCVDERDAAERTLFDYTNLWHQDFERENVSFEQAIDAMLDINGKMVNVWMSMTPGGIEQQPLVLAKTNEPLTANSFLTMPVNMNGLNETISLFKMNPEENLINTEKYKFFYVPKMEFGEVLIFTMSKIPHSAVWLKNVETAFGRQSAEMRMLLLPKNKMEL